MKPSILLISFLSLVVACNSPTGEEQLPKTVSQKIGQTNIILSEPTDPIELNLYDKIEFFIEQEKVFEYSEEHLQIEGFNSNVCTFFEEKKGKEFAFYYVFRFNNRPSLHKFLGKWAGK